MTSRMSKPAVTLVGTAILVFAVAVPASARIALNRLAANTTQVALHAVSVSGVVLPDGTVLTLR